MSHHRHGRRHPGGNGARTSATRNPQAIDDWRRTFPNLTIIMAHPGWPWVDEPTAVAVAKGNVFWRCRAGRRRYFPAQVQDRLRARLQDKSMFGSDYPSMP